MYWKYITYLKKKTYWKDSDAYLHIYGQIVIDSLSAVLLLYENTVCKTMKWVTVLVIC